MLTRRSLLVGTAATGIFAPRVAKSQLLFASPVAPLCGGTRGIALQEVFNAGTWTGNSYSFALEYQDATWGMTNGRIAKLQAANANLIRIFLTVSPFMFVAQQASLLATLVSAIQINANAGFSSSIVLYLQGSSGGNPYYPTNTFTALNSANFILFCQTCAYIAQGLLTSFPPSVVQVELLNEPDNSEFIGGTAEEYMLVMYNYIRATAPKMTICFSTANASGGYSGYSAILGTLPNVTYAGIDNNTRFLWHPYQPTTFTQQAASLIYINNLAFPPSSNVGGLSAAITAMTALVNADGSLNPGQKTAAIASNTALLNTYFNTPQDEAWLTAQIASVAAWRVSQGIAANRVYAGEFGVETYVGSGLIGADLASAAAFFSTSTSAFISAGFPYASYSLSQSTSYDYPVLDGSDNWLAGYQAALFP